MMDRAGLWALTACLSACSPQSIVMLRYDGTGGGQNAGGAAGSSSMTADAAGSSSITAGAAGASPTGPMLVASLDISKGGPMTRILLGDVSGDGRLDVVTVQPATVEDSELPHSVSMLSAFELDGTLLWQVGESSGTTVSSRSNLPAQIYDIDADGYNEVLAVIQGELRVFDGKTGTLEASHALPDPNAHDSLLIANFSGRAHPRDLVLKNRFDRIWAFDQNFNQLFTFGGEVGYFPWAYDWDGDGRDELVAGCNYLDHDGTLRWSRAAAVTTVVSGIWSAELDGNTTNGREILIAGGVTVAYDQTGAQVFRLETVDAENILIGDFRPDLPGMEVAGLDRLDTTAQNSRDGKFVASSKGELLVREERPIGSDWGTVVSLVRDWDSTHRDLILSYRRANELPSLFDGYLQPVVTFPEMSALMMAADVCGDERQEIIAYTDAYVHVYASAICDMNDDVTGTPRPQPKSLYNWSRNWGGDQ